MHINNQGESMYQGNDFEIKIKMYEEGKIYGSKNIREK